MVLFNYVAKDTATGEIVKSEVQADSEQTAARLLMSQHLFPISITSGEASQGLVSKLRLGSGIPTKDRIVFTRQLATLISAGLPLIQSLRTIHEQVSNKKLQDVVAAIIASVEGGSTLAAAFGQHPTVFNQIYLSLIEAGETSGSLDKALQRIALQQEKDSKLVSKIRGALIYPAIVLLVVLLVLVFMLVTIVPQVTSLYVQLKKPLPILTRLLADGSGFIVHFWWLVLIILGGLGYALVRFMRTSEGGHLLDQVKLHTPLFGSIFNKIYMARFARTLGSLLGSGVPMLQGLEVVRQAVGNGIVSADIETAMGQVRGGKALSASLMDKETFLILVPQMISIGEQSGAIDSLLDRTAGYYEDEVDEAVANISTLIEPILMVVLGVLVGLVIAAVLLPIYSLVGGGINLS